MRRLKNIMVNRPRYIKRGVCRDCLKCLGSGLCQSHKCRYPLAWRIAFLSQRVQTVTWYLIFTL